MQAPRVLHYVVSPTRVGVVLVLMSREGVVDIVLIASNAASRDVVRSLMARYPGTRLLPDDGARRSWAAAVVDRIDGVRPDFVAPIDLAWSAASKHSEVPTHAQYERAS